MFYKEFRNLIKRIQFYIFLLSIFLGIEIPLLMLSYFKILPKHRNLVWIFTLFVSILCGYIVNYVISGIIKEDYRIKILFDTNSYKNQNEKLKNEE